LKIMKKSTHSWYDDDGTDVVRVCVWDTCFLCYFWDFNLLLFVFFLKA